MNRKLLQIAASIAALATVAACSSSPNANSAADLPDTATLCELELELATVSDAERVLGMPTTRSDYPTQTVLLYRFGDAFLSLHFDEAGRFTSTTTIQLPYPECWQPAENQKDP